MSLLAHYRRLLDAIDGTLSGTVSPTDIEGFLRTLPTDLAAVLRNDLSKFEIRVEVIDGKRTLTRRRKRTVRITRESSSLNPHEDLRRHETAN